MLGFLRQGASRFLSQCAQVDSVPVLNFVAAALIDKGGDLVGLRYFYIQNKCI